MIPLDYTGHNWKDIFWLNPESPSGLSWSKRGGGRRIILFAGNRKFTHKDKRPIGYAVKYNCVDYLVSRIVWVLAYGTIDSDLVIDHLDGDPFNNNLANLSLKTTQGNSQNHKRQSNNKSGVTGVSLFLEPNSSRSYYKSTYENIDGKQKTKYFPIHSLGKEVAFESAVQHRKKMLEYLNANGCVYTDRHGS